MTCLRQGNTIVCTSGRKPLPLHCRWCGCSTEILCDFVLKKQGQPARRCDAPACDAHSVEVGTDRHHCQEHRHEQPGLKF